MKKLARNIIVIFLALIIYVAGAGLTLIDFCCTSCIKEQVMLADAQSCCENTENEKDSHEFLNEKDEANHASHHCESHHAEESECCQIQRLDIDNLYSSQYRIQINEPFLWMNTGFVTNEYLLSDNTSDINFLAGILKIPPTPLPRAYLSMLRVLII